ncbi:MAG: MATE family efflux transporter [Clostridia bacterium]|nr:MATE family efflux transporter [Clostridia bacterium]
MRMFSLPEGARFSNKVLIAFLMPVLFEQLMLAGLTMADTFMVSSLGETAVAGVALVNRIDNFAKQFFVSLAQGGSVVLSQYIGARDEDKAEISLKSNVRIVVLIGLAVMLFMVVFKEQTLHLLFGGAEANVLAISREYFTITALSYPFVALYYAGSATFRAMGESKIPFMASIAMMGINLLLKYIFIFVIKIGVTGAAYSTLLAMGIVGFGLMLMLKGKKNRVRMVGFFKPDWDKKIVKSILTVSVPNGIEQGMFQLGALAIAGLVSGLGQASIAADSLARSITPLLYSIGAAFNAVMMMVVGQCMGAGNSDEAEMYAKHIIKLDYVLTFCNAILFMVLLKPLISVFNVSPEAQHLAFWIMVLYTSGTIFMYPLSFALAAGLRGSGDTKFVMVIAVASMFLFRIGAAYIFVHLFHWGVIGTWVAMVSDWFIRSTLFMIRFKKGKWKLNKVI